MPYIRRNWKGEITDLFLTPQFDDAVSFLADDSPELIAYLAKNPNAQVPKPPTGKEFSRFVKKWNKAEDDLQRLHEIVSRFTTAFSGLEGDLSLLLQRLLNLGESKIAFAIYYSPTSFDARSELVGNTVIQLAAEQTALKDLTPLWEKIADYIDRIRRLRNAVAHSSPITHGINGKFHVRLSPPAFDIIRIDRKRDKRQLPGLGASDLQTAERKIFLLRQCIEDVNFLLREWQEGNPSLQGRFAELRRSLAQLGSHES